MAIPINLFNNKFMSEVKKKGPTSSLLTRTPVCSPGPAIHKEHRSGAPRKVNFNREVKYKIVVSFRVLG